MNDADRSDMADERAGDVDYATTSVDYATLRRPDPRIGALIHQQLGAARTVLNIGAGTGSYEPTDRHVIAIEPSREMRARRAPPCVPAINGRAEAIPLDDQSIDASMGTITVHQWRDLDAGLCELVRVTRGPIVIMAFDPDLADRYWLNDFVPEMIAAQRARDPAIKVLADALGRGGRAVKVLPVPIPADCTDGFTEAYYARPERFLDPAVTRAQSTWNFVEPSIVDRFRRDLRAALDSGAWDARHGALRATPSFEGSLCLIVSAPNES